MIINFEDNEKQVNTGQSQVEGDSNISKDLSPSLETKYKFWVSTFFGDLDEMNYFKLWIKKRSKIWIFGYEICPNSGRPHLQTFFEHKAKYGCPYSILVKAFPTTYFRKADSNIQNNISYCAKSGEFETNYITPKILNLIKPENFYQWQSDIINLITESPNDRTIYWFWEESGCSGKTAIAKYIAANYNAICVSGKSENCKNAILQYFNLKKYYPDIIIYNVPRSNHEFINYEGMESIKDGFFYCGKYEGGMALFNSPHVIVFANDKPDYDKLSSDRWHVSELNRPTVI